MPPVFLFKRVRKSAGRLSAIVAAACLSVAANPSAGKPPQESEAKRLVNLFQARYRAAHTLQATFLERYVENGAEVRVEAGNAYFRRPGKMRWEYERPERDVFLVDGKNAWFYVPTDHTVLRVPAKESTDWRTPLALLAGEMKVSRVCAKVTLATHEEPQNDQDVVLRCELPGAEKGQQGQPSGADFETTPGGGKADAVFFEIAKTTGELVRLLVRQSGGSEVEFRFENWRLNPPVPEASFHFQVPVGVAIVNGELPTGDNTVK